MNLGNVFNSLPAWLTESVVKGCPEKLSWNLPGGFDVCSQCKCQAILKKRFDLVVDEFSDQRTSAGRLLRGRLIRISNRENGFQNTSKTTRNSPAVWQFITMVSLFRTTFIGTDQTQPTFWNDPWVQTFHNGLSVFFVGAGGGGRPQKN